MFHVVEKLVYAMATLRFLSGVTEITGGLLMLYFGTSQKALQVNGALALVGPFVLIAVTAIGISGMGEVNIRRIALLVIGVGCILYGARG